MRKIVITILVIIVLICGCVASTANVDGKHCVLYWKESYGNVGEIIKFSIPDDNVTCYVYSAGYQGGMSCLRDDVK